MDFDAAYEYLFDGFAVVVDSSDLTYLGEDDGSFYVDLENGDRRVIFTKEKNPGILEIVRGGFILKDENGREWKVQRLNLDEKPGT